MSQEQQKAPTVAVELTEQDIQVVFAGLGELPYKHAVTTIQSIDGQLQAKREELEAMQKARVDAETAEVEDKPAE